MEVLVQDVPCVAGYLPYGQPDAQLILTIAVKASYTVEDGLLVPEKEPIPLWEKDMEWEGLSVLRDLTPMKAGCDLIVLGEAIAPGLNPVPMMNVNTRIGSLHHSLIIWGDRRWERGPKGYRPSPPTPFTNMPIDWEHAFGGSCLSPVGETVSNGNNPIGKGFRLIDEPDHISGSPLPNIEQPDQQMREWADQPRPAGFSYYPSTWGMRLQQGVEVNATGEANVKPIFFNQAHPDLILGSFPDGEVLTISGMTADQPFSVRIERPPITARLVNLLTINQMDLRWDTICAIPAQNRVFMIGRCAFRYDPNEHWASEVHIIESPQEAT